MGAFSHLDIICPRRVPLIYVSPPVCENDFSSTGQPIIVLNPLRRRRGPTGFRAEALGAGLRFKWDSYPGAICFSIYKAVDADNPNGEFTLVAECVPGTPCDPDQPETLCYDCPECTNGCYRITAITLDGETIESDTTCLVADFVGSPTSGEAPLTVSFTDGSVGNINTRFWDFGDGNTALDPGLNFNHIYFNEGVFTVSLTVTGDFGSTTLTRQNYIVVTPVIPPGPGEVCVLRIVDYGTVLEPNFVGPVAAPNSADTEWDGIWNILTGPDSTYWYKGSNDVYSVPVGVGPNIAVGGKAVSFMQINGPRAAGGDIPDDYWFLGIAYETGFGPEVIWVGYKIGGNTTSPAGVYVSGEVLFPIDNPPGTFSDSRFDIEVEICEF